MAIYYGGGQHWKVDKKLALPMNLTVRYERACIIQYSPSGNVWWLTGFNSDSQDPEVDKITAQYKIYTSSKKSWYNALYNKCKKDRRMTFSRSKKYISIIF